MNKGREVFVTDFWDSTSNLGTIRNTRGATYIGFIVLCKENKKDQSNNREGFRQGGIEYKYQTVSLTCKVNFRILFHAIQTSHVNDGIQICSCVNAICEN